MPQQIEVLDAQFREMSRELERLSVWHKAQQKALKSRFNVFTALLKFDDEVKLHSRWLHYLLNPKADHDCGSQFLDLFIKTLREVRVQRHHDDDSAEWDDLKELEEPEKFATEAAKVRNEMPISYGINRRVDIHIENMQWGAIVIENKTRLGEGEFQISDYADYCIAHCEGSGRKFLLLFLTPFGDRSKTAGEHEDRYRRISYRKHILPWLEACLCATYPFVHINQALQQYKNVVRQLIGRTSDYAYMEQVITILKQHPAIIEYRDDINQAIDSIRNECYDAFLSQLSSRLATSGVKLSPLSQERRYELSKEGTLERMCDTEAKVWLSSKDKSTFVLALIHQSDDANKRKALLANKEGLGSANAALGSAFLDKFDWKNHEWWPLGEITFSDVISLKVLADWVSQREGALTSQLDDLAKNISLYFEVLNKIWPDVAKNE